MQYIDIDGANLCQSNSPKYAMALCMVVQRLHCYDSYDAIVKYRNKKVKVS